MYYDKSYRTSEISSFNQSQTQFTSLYIEVKVRRRSIVSLVSNIMFALSRQLRANIETLVVEAN